LYDEGIEGWDTVRMLKEFNIEHGGAARWIICQRNISYVRLDLGFKLGRSIQAFAADLEGSKTGNFGFFHMALY